MKSNLSSNTWKKRLTVFTLSFSMVLGLTPAFATKARAATDTSTDAINEIRQQSADNDDTFAPEEGHSLKNTGSKPAAFDLRHVNENGTETNYITPVRQQNPYGSCWGFGAIAAAESSILSSGLASDPKTLNLSEKQIAWYVTKEINDPSNSQNGEGVVGDSSITDSDRYNNGGFTLYATNMFACGVGPVAEDTSTNDGDIYRYKGKNGIVVNGRVSWYNESGVEETGFRKKYYSPDDDWSMAEEYRFRQDYKLKESYLLPSPSVSANDGTNAKVYQPEGTEAIKEQLLNKRAVCISVYANHSRPGESSDSAHFGDFWAQYDTSPEPNHVVTIVGYDDNFPKSKFKEGQQPPGNGAWLVKNSWGSDLCDFPDNGYSHWGLFEGQDRIGGNYEATSKLHTGYYWLSYYDSSLTNPEAYSFEMAGSDDQTVNQYDYMPVMEYQEYATESPIRMANVFREDKNRKIEDISFFTATPGTTVSYKIYLLQKSWSDVEEDGKCVYTSSPKTYQYGGYHLETLDPGENIIVSRNQDYAIVVEEKTPSGKYSISFGQSKGGNLGGLKFNPVINKKESFLYMDEAWNDLSNKTLQNTLTESSDNMVMDNFPIKVGLSPVDNKDVYFELQYLSDQNPDILKTGEISYFEVNFTGGTEDLSFTPNIEWSSSNPDILKVEPVNSDNGKGKLTGMKKGTAYLIVDAGVYGKRILKVEVMQLGLSSIYMGPEVVTMPYTGEAITPEVLDVSGESSNTPQLHWGLVKDQDYTLSYDNNVKCGKGTVTATGIGTFGSDADAWFVIVPAKGKINKLTPGENKVTVSFESQKESGISGYIITYKETGTDETKTMQVEADANTAVINNLTPGKTYDISIKAYVTIDEDYLIINKETFDGRIPEENVDYFGQDSDTVTSDKVLEKAKEASDGDPADSASVAGTYKQIQALKKDGDLKGSSFLPMGLRSNKVSSSKIRLNWKKVSGADGYILYGNRCGSKYKMKKLAQLSSSKNTWVYKKLKKGKYYKFLIVAYKIKGGSKTVIKSSKTIHVATGGGKVGNHKKVKLNKTRIMLKKGKTFKLKAKAIPASKKKVKRHVAVRFESSDKKVAKVSKAGKIKAIGKGTCYVYAYAQNGIFKKAKVTVK